MITPPPTNSPLDGPPRVWQRVAELHARRARREVIYDNVLRAHLPPDVLDRRGLLLWTGEQFARGPEYAADWIADGLSLRGLEHWRRLRAACAAVTASFFADAADGCAWVYYESCRDPVAKQGAGVTQHHWGSDWSLPPLTPRRRGSYSFASGARGAAAVDVPLDALRFAGANGRASPSERLVRFGRARGVPASGLPPGVFETWCLADPVDDRQCVDGGRIPAGRALQVNPDVNIGRLFNWVKVDAGGRLSAFSLEAHPGTAQPVSARRCLVPLELLLRIHPRYENWLARALDSSPPSAWEENYPEPHAAVSVLLRGSAGSRRRALRHLRVLRAVAEGGSLGAAARLLDWEGQGRGGDERHSQVRYHLDRLSYLLGVQLRAAGGELSASGEALRDWLCSQPVLLAELDKLP